MRRRLRVVLALAVGPALALAGWLHWSEVKDARDHAERARATRTKLEDLRLRAPKVVASLAALEADRRRIEVLTAVLENLARAGGGAPAALASVATRGHELGVTAESAWAAGEYVEVMGRAGDRRAVRLLGQTLEEEGLATDVDLWRLEADGRFALLARLPKPVAR